MAKETHTETAIVIFNNQESCRADSSENSAMVFKNFIQASSRKGRCAMHTIPIDHTLSVSSELVKVNDPVLPTLSEAEGFVIRYSRTDS